MRLSVAPLALLLAACHPGEGKDDTGPVGGADATDIVATVSPAMATVLIVTWSTAEPTAGFVMYGEDENYAQQTPVESEATTDHRALLLGLPGDTEVHFRVATTQVDTLLTSADQVAHTDPIPNGFPTLTRTGGDDPVGGFISLPVIGAVTAATFVDTQGRIVWYHIEDRDYVVQRVRLANDGASVLYNAVWLQDLDPKGEIVRVSLDGTTMESYPAPHTTHDFVELPDGSLCAIYTDIREIEGSDVYGDAILEIAPDGTSRTVWSAYDTYDPITEPSMDDSDSTWTHVNALHYDADHDALYVNLRNFSSMIKLDRQTGDVLWTLGGYHDEYTWGGDTEKPHGEHGFEFVSPSELLMFNNGEGSAAASHAMGFDIDQDAHTIEQTWAHHHDPELYVWAMGDVERRSDGGTRVTWSTSGTMEQLDASGAFEWDLSVGFGTVFGYTGWYSSLQGG